MELSVRRLVVRSSFVAAVALGSVVVVGPEAVADAPCPDGTARIFFSDETNTCQGAGTVSYTSRAKRVSRTCSTVSATVTVAVTEEIGYKSVEREVEYIDGRCGAFNYKIQSAASVTVTPG